MKLAFLFATLLSTIRFQIGSNNYTLRYFSIEPFKTNSPLVIEYQFYSSPHKLLRTEVTIFYGNLANKIVLFDDYVSYDALNVRQQIIIPYISAFEYSCFLSFRVVDYKQDPYCIVYLDELSTIKP
ncbi:MAG: hypothetical protein LBR37_04090, partial [Erysipelotrichaceae bacterium]|nr:hypothetical protein [Erysipelotrichaceae bacterium]